MLALDQTFSFSAYPPRTRDRACHRIALLSVWVPVAQDHNLLILLELHRRFDRRSIVFKMRSHALITRLSALVLCVCFSLMSEVFSQSSTSRQKLRAEPPELAGEPPPKPAPPTPASLEFVQSKAISAANPHDPTTLGPANSRTHGTDSA